MVTANSINNTIVPAPVNPTDAVNKAYVDFVAAGFNFKNTTKAGSTVALTTTYANGTAGVGATLTNAGAKAAFAIDGYTAFLHDRILIKDQADSFENGIYQVEVLGSGAVNWVLMRTTDYDTPAEMSAGSIVPVQFGTVNAETLWLQTTTVVTIGADAVTYNQFLAAYPFATVAQTKTGTSTTTMINPAGLVGYTSDMVMTGWLSWAAGGPYFDDTTLGTFKLLVGGTGYIKGKLITWTAQDYVGMVAGNCYFIYIDSTGTIGAATAHTDAIYENNIILFECLRDSTPVTNNQLTVCENHPYSFQVQASNYLHDTIGPVIESYNGGANIVLNGTQGIQINGDDVLADHGLKTTIPDSAAAAVTFIKMYTTAAGKWARQNATTTFTGFWNNAGTPTALSANRYALYTLYVSKESLNTTTPTYIAVLDTVQYSSSGSVTTAISNGTTAKATNELAALELAQLGYVVFRQSTNAISSVIISKSTIRSGTTTSGTNQASLVNTNVTDFNGWLSSVDTNVQSALDTLDDSQRCVEVTAAAANLVTNQGVIANRGTLVTLTLPTVAKVGDTLEVVGSGAGGWLIAQNANQIINFPDLATTTGVGGSIASISRYAAIKLICITANLVFVVVSCNDDVTVV